jgi:hypothetical protein
MFLWRKFAEHHWLKAHENLLQERASGQLAIAHRPGRKRLELEIVCRSRRDSSELLKEFGGRIEALPRNWLKRFACVDSKLIKIGKLLVVSSVGETLVSRPSRHKGRFHIIIPASLAFGSGAHATTAMSLRFLEQLTRRWNPGWSLVDLGTGSGILALAAKCFGAGRQRSRCDFGGQIKRPIEQNSRRHFSIRRFARMELGTGDRCDRGKLIQRFAYRNPAQITRRRVANSLRHFAQAARRISSRTAAESPRHHQHDASREMDGFSGAAGPALCGRRSVGRQIFAALIDPRYSKNRCNPNSLLMPLSHPIRCGNRAPAASLAG